MEKLNKDNASEYEAFVEGHPKGHFMQSALWAKVKPEWRFEALIARGADGAIKGTMALLIRRVPKLRSTIMYCPRGPVCDIYDADTLRLLLDGARALAKQNRSYVLKIDPDVPSSDERFGRIMRELGFKTRAQGKNFEAIQPRYVFRLYLGGRSEDEIMASFHQKTRYNIRVALKKGVETRIADEDALPDFHRIMMETGVRDGFVIRSEQYFRGMLRSLGEHARLYMAYLDGKPIAGTLCIAYGDKVWYLYGASSNEARNVMPNYLLQWEMIKWAIERGARVYDFRGVSGDIDESNPLYGLYRFKKGFNGEFTEFIGEMDLVFSPFLNFAFTKGERFYRSMRKRVFLLKNRNRDSGPPAGNV